MAFFCSGDPALQKIRVLKNIGSLHDGAADLAQK